MGYRQVGALVLAGSPERQADITGQLLARRADAPEIGHVAALTGAQARELFPPLRPDLPAVSVGGACRVDGRRLAASLVRAAERRGATVMAGRAELVCRSGRAAGVRLGDQVIEGDAVVVAAGAWTRALLEPAGVTVPVEPQRGQIAHISLAPADTSRWPVVLPSASRH